MNFSMSIYSGVCGPTVVRLLLDKHILLRETAIRPFRNGFALYRV